MGNNWLGKPLWKKIKKLESTEARFLEGLLCISKYETTI
jgi:hypothetical protein